MGKEGAGNMSEPTCKKRKIEDENGQFKEEWTTKYFMQHFNGAAVCLICCESVTVLKDFNCKWHYETKHTEKKFLGQSTAHYVIICVVVFFDEQCAS